jgi:hypothetical protein
MTSARKRPSLAVTLAGAALVAALAALVLSLTGVATGLPGKNRIDGNDLRPNVVGFRNMRNNAIGRAEMRNKAIGGPEVRPNSLGGYHVKENTLGKVPSAANADAVDGLSAAKFSRSGGPFAPDPPVTVLDLNGLQLIYACVPDAGDELPFLAAKTTVDHAQLSFGVGEPGFASVAHTDDDWNMSESPFSLTGIGPGKTSGTLAYRNPNGKVVTVTWGTTSTEGNCHAFGTALTG